MILLIVGILQIGHVLYAGASTPIPVEVETVNKLFTHIVTDSVFSQEWDLCFTEPVNSFFAKQIPTPIKKYAHKVSFAGEFIRFLRNKIIDPQNESSTFTVFQATSTTWSSTIVNRQVKRNSERSAADDLPVFFLFVALDGWHKVPKGSTWSANNMEHRYYLVGGTILSDGTVKIELGDFLTNANLPLENKEQQLEHIPDAIMNDFRKWLLNQEKEYSSL